MTYQANQTYYNGLKGTEITIREINGFTANVAVNKDRRFGQQSKLTILNVPVADLEAISRKGYELEA